MLSKAGLLNILVLKKSWTWTLQCMLKPVSHAEMLIRKWVKSKMYVVIENKFHRLIMWTALFSVK